MDRTIRIEDYKCGDEKLKVVIKEDLIDSRKCIYSTLISSTGEELSPKVKTIKYDKENNVFLLQDKIAITEYLTCSLFVYIDTNGNPLGMMFSDVIDGFINIPFKNKKEFLSGYVIYKYSFARKLKEEIYKKNETKIESAKKLALVSKEG